MIGVDKVDGMAMKRRQKLLQEQGILDTLLAIIHRLKPISEKLEAQANATKVNAGTYILIFI